MIEYVIQKRGIFQMAYENYESVLIKGFGDDILSAPVKLNLQSVHFSGIFFIAVSTTIFSIIIPPII
jgi:hypothetical protein